MSQTVLLVDDEANLISGLQRTLRSEPFRILTATTGEEALGILAREAVDVLVSDNQMPGMGGLELLTTVRRQHPEVVNLMLSGEASIGTVIRALNHGQIFRFLIKPCAPDELRLSIQQGLAHKQLLDQCRLMLPMFRRQSAILSAIESRHPGMVRSVQSQIATLTTIKIKEEASTVEELSERMDVEIRRADSGLSHG